jgi:hypothetical protein
MEKLMPIVGIILALSIASERLVEIIKGVIPWLNKKKLDEENNETKTEGMRCACLQTLAVLSGVLTAFLARDYIPKEIAEPTKGLAIIGLGLLASGGSGFWNSMLTYFTNLKDIKKAKAIQALKTAAQRPGSPGMMPNAQRDA